MEEWVKKLQENAEINTQNQSASLKNLETQIEQLTKEFHTKAANKINNSPFDQCKAVYADEKTPIDNRKHEINPINFTLPCTIGSLNFYAMADLGASVNVIPKSMFEHLKLAQLKKTDMLVEMVDMMKRSPIGIVENVLVKIDKFLFPSDDTWTKESFRTDAMKIQGKDLDEYGYWRCDKTKEAEEGDSSETLLCQLPPKEMNPGSFTLPCTIGNLKLYVMADLGILVVNIDVFRREISLRIGEEKVKLDMNGRICHSRVPFEKIYITSSVQESEYFNPLEIETGVFSYDSPACLLFEQSTHPCSDVSIDIVDSSDHMQELKGSQEDEVGSHLLENVVSRWHVCKPICVTVKDCEKDYGKWPTCNPDLSFCSGYDAIYRKKESGMLKQGIFFEIMKTKIWDTACQWHDEGFEEEEQWESGIENTCYTPPCVKSETFEVKR
ncbi:copia protein [Tanacetum coccineum]